MKRSTFAYGVFLGDAESARDAIDESIETYTQKVGAKPAIIKTFFRLDDDFSAGGWPGQVARAVQRAGATNLIALDLGWNGAPDADLLRAIVQGAADRHLHRLAAGLRQLDTEVLLEPAWEMNGNWGYAWQGVANGGDERATRTFVQAWRHIVDLVRADGATNVRFVFSPNTGNALARGAGAAHWNWYGHYYPGAEWVDVIGLHGFNGPSVWGGSSASFLDLFDGPAMDHMLSDASERFPDKPILIAELASEESPDKAAWIAAAYAAMETHPQVMGAIWFDMKKEADWRIDSSAPALESYRQMIRPAAIARR